MIKNKVLVWVTGNIDNVEKESSKISAFMNWEIRRKK